MADRQSQLITEIASIPTVSSGNFIHNDDDYELNLNIRKYSGDFTKKSNYIWQSNGQMCESNSEIKFRSYSPDGKFLLIGRSSGEKDRFVEVWSSCGRCYASTINVTNLHGDFLTDELFGSFVWSPNGEKFIYVAEKKSPSSADEEPKFAKFIEKENFGERLQNVFEPVFCLFVVSSMQIKVIKLDSKSLSFHVAQPSFIDNDSIVFMGIQSGAKKLGMTYIYCRPTSIYTMNLNDNNSLDRISSAESSSRSPIVSRDGKQMVYLRNSLGRSHFKASQLILYNLESKKDQIIVDIVKNPKGGFPGIYCQRIPAQRFTSTIYLNTCWKDLRPVLGIDVSTGSISNLIPEFMGSARILDINKDSLLVCGSTATCPGTIFILKNGMITTRLKIAPIDGNPIHQSLSEELESTVLELNANVNVVVLKEKAKKRMPLIIVPHGGPNSVYSVDYVLYPAILAKMGYAVASVNYTGSIGFGDDSIEALEGQIGIRDVEDCYLALKMLLKDDSYDAKRVIVMGGSHGGYLAAYLSAKYPETFIGAILRNPVIDLPSTKHLGMTVTSDISDWTFGQLGLDFDQIKTRPINEAEMKLFQDRSPSKYSQNVRCKTLVMLGALDLRVPPSQGKYWASLLKGNGVDCQVLWFPDANHGLDTAESERFGLEAILNFLKNL